MQVGHHKVEGSVRAAGEVWIPHAVLFGEFGAVENRVPVIEVGEGVAVGADREVGAVGLVFEVDHDIAGKVLFRKRAGFGGGGELGHDLDARDGIRGRIDAMILVGDCRFHQRGDAPGIFHHGHVGAGEGADRPAAGGRALPTFVPLGSFLGRLISRHEGNIGRWQGEGGRVLVRHGGGKGFYRLGRTVGRLGVGFDPRHLQHAVDHIGIGAGATEQVVEGHAVIGHGGIEEDHVPNPFGDAIHHASDDHATVAVAGQHDVMQILEEDEVHHIVDVGFEIDVGTGEMDAFAEAGEGGAVDGVAISLEEVGRGLPFPAAGGGTMDHHVGQGFSPADAGEGGEEKAESE